MNVSRADCLRAVLSELIIVFSVITWTVIPVQADVTQMNVKGDDGFMWAVQVHDGCDFLSHTKSDCGGWYKINEGRTVHLVVLDWTSPINMRDACNHEVMHHELFWTEHNVFIGDGHHKIMAERGIPETKMCREAVHRWMGVWV